MPDSAVASAGITPTSRTTGGVTPMKSALRSASRTPGSCGLMARMGFFARSPALS